MSFLLFLRDRVLPYLLLVCIIIGIGGSFVWFFMRAYFWNTSQLTLITEEETLTAKIDISARIFFVDIPLFWWGVYPIHITFPYSRTVSCSWKCVLTDIPAGEARVMLSDRVGTQSIEMIDIKPDTQGVIDIRMPIWVREILPSEVLENWEINLELPIKTESIFSDNTFQGLWLFYDVWIPFLYDAASRQTLLMPNDSRILSAFRGIQEGEYYLVTHSNDVLFYDRYGRKKTEKVTHSMVSESDLIWENHDGNITTRLRIWDKERVLYGRFFWHNVENKYYLFDGNKIFEIINR